ncbi:MAG: GntR family transcriptional regulator [Clostridia bacterium]|nr:GntR family transcriptional regulator [Clostridia bacterium]
MSVINVDTRDRKPIYEQLIDNIKQLVLHGMLKPDEQLPGVRTLAGELAINPNTIAKAYAELERQGIIYSIQGRGSFVCDNIEHLANAQRAESTAEVKKALERALDAGVTKDEIAKMLDLIWREQND